MEIPSFFTDPQLLITYNYNQLSNLVDTDIDFYQYIDNLSIPLNKNKLVVDYFKSIQLGYNHTYIQKLLENYQTNHNICLPLLHSWNTNPQIENLIIISDPEDSERICKNHVKKAPIFKSFLYDSIISTTDNQDWKDQRGIMNMAFIPKLSLEKIFPISQDRARLCSKLLKDISNNYQNSINISEFFLNETQAQLQLAMFGFSNKFQEKTNKRLRNAFAGIETDYINEFAKIAIQEAKLSKGPLSKLFHNSDNSLKDIGNIIIFSFAGHDTTAHTLTWLLYELCKNPQHKQTLIEEIDTYWKNHNTESYQTFHELPFMTQCITETLRLWPALANGTFRELEYDDTIKGINGEPIKVPKGTYCQIINWTRHRSQELWGDDVNIFNPYRKFKDSEIWNYEGFNTYNVYSDRFSPFTYGPRNCIGKNFSQMEMRLILLNIFKDHDIQLSEEQQKTVYNEHYQGINTFTMGPKSIHKNELIGMYINLQSRKSKL